MISFSLKTIFILLACIMTGCTTLSNEPFVPKAVQGIPKDQVAVLIADRDIVFYTRARITHVWNYNNREGSNLLSEGSYSPQYPQVDLLPGTYQIVVHCLSTSIYSDPRITLTLKAGETYQLTCTKGDEPRTSRLQATVSSHVAPKPGEPNAALNIVHIGEFSGVFELTLWNAPSYRYLTQRIDVYKYDAPDIPTAMVKKMKEVIRNEKRDDLILASRQFGRPVALDRRPENDTELNQFLMKEFFPDYVPGK